MSMSIGDKFGEIHNQGTGPSRKSSPANDQVDVQC